MKKPQIFLETRVSPFIDASHCPIWLPIQVCFHNSNYDYWCMNQVAIWVRLWRQSKSTVNQNQEINSEIIYCQVSFFKEPSIYYIINFIGEGVHYIIKTDVKKDKTNKVKVSYLFQVYHLFLDPKSKSNNNQIRTRNEFHVNSCKFYHYTSICNLQISQTSLPQYFLWTVIRESMSIHWKKQKKYVILFI